MNVEKGLFFDSIEKGWVKVRGGWKSETCLGLSSEMTLAGIKLSSVTAFHLETNLSHLTEKISGKYKMVVLGEDYAKTNVEQVVSRRFKEVYDNYNDIRTVSAGMAEEYLKQIQIYDVLTNQDITNIENAIINNKNAQVFVEELKKIGKDEATLIESQKVNINNFEKKIAEQITKIESLKKDITNLQEKIESQIKQIRKFIKKVNEVNQNIQNINDVSKRIKYVLEEIDVGGIIMIEG